MYGYTIFIKREGGLAHLVIEIVDVIIDPSLQGIRFLLLSFLQIEDFLLHEESKVIGILERIGSASLMFNRSLLMGREHFGVHKL